MTVEEFESLAQGDIVSHSTSPWAQWVVYAYDFRMGGLLIIRSNGMKTETARMANPEEWSLLSKVKEREYYETLSENG